MKYRGVAQVVTWVVVVVFAAGIVVSGDQVQASWFRFASIAVLIASGLLTAWDLVLWRLPLVQRLNKVPPAINGTWRGTLATQWLDPQTGSLPAVKEAFLVVKQSASSCSVALYTGESASHSSMSMASQSSDDGWTVDYIYLNEPELEHRAKSGIHHGGGILRIVGKPAVRISGTYWTDRDSKGQLKFDEFAKRRGQDFESCQVLFR